MANFNEVGFLSDELTVDKERARRVATAYVLFSVNGAASA